MVFLIFFAMCIIGVVAGEYGHLPSSGHAYISPYDDRSDDHYNHDKRHYHHLKSLEKGTFNADIRYFKHKGSHYAEISCAKRNDFYVWILAESDETIPAVFGQSKTVALAGGVNVQYVAKYSNGKWIGRDYVSDKKHTFRRIGCYQGESDAVIYINQV